MTAPVPSPEATGQEGRETAALLRALLFQSVMPEEDPENCGGCKAMVRYATALRIVSAPSAGSDLCPWHGGHEAGRARHAPRRTGGAAVVSPQDAPTDGALCSSPYYVPGEGIWHCTLRPGHRGEHEDSDGHWWYREDQLETL